MFLHLSNTSNKGALLAALYTPEQLRRIDTAVPIGNWEPGRLWAMCSNYNREGSGLPLVENLLETAAARGVTFTYSSPEIRAAALAAVGPDFQAQLAGPCLSEVQTALDTFVAAGFSREHLARCIAEQIGLENLTPA